MNFRCDFEVNIPSLADGVTKLGFDRTLDILVRSNASPCNLARVGVLGGLQEFVKMVGWELNALTGKFSKVK